MKKILRIFAFCVAFMSSGELVHAQVFVKTDAVKSVWSDYDFNEQGTTLESVIVFCMNKSGATISDCRDKVKQIVANHNQIIKHDKSVQVPLSNEKSNLSGNEISQIIITRDLDGGTRVSGNCDSEIVVKYGTRVTLDCDAVKHGKNLTGYIDQDDHKMSKNSFFSYAEPGYTELTIPVTKSLKAVYGESETKKSDGTKKNTNENLTREREKTKNRKDGSVRSTENTGSREKQFFYYDDDYGVGYDPKGRVYSGPNGTGDFYAKKSTPVIIPGEKNRTGQPWSCKYAVFESKTNKKIAVCDSMGGEGGVVSMSFKSTDSRYKNYLFELECSSPVLLPGDERCSLNLL